MSDLKLDQFYFQDSFLKEQLTDVDFSGLTEGKNLRSRLLYLMGELYDIPIDHRLQLGRVVELVHNATLTHDDVIDNSHIRRDSPSMPALMDNKKSVLLGDYMLAKALHELSQFNNPALTTELTLTLKELVEGEWIQYENTDPYEISHHLYTTLATKKTGSLFRWCFVAPHVAFYKGQANDQTYKLLSEFGEKLGIIFQMTDDIIDFNPKSKKTFGLDFQNNNINFVLHFVGLHSPELKSHMQKTNTIAELNGDALKIISHSVELAKKAVQEHLKRCLEILEKLKEKYETSQHTPLCEFGSILDLVSDRVF